VLRCLAIASPSWCDQLRLLDSTPVPCGQSVQTVKRSPLAPYAGYGYCASHSRWFWGMRLYLTCGAPAGQLGDLCVLPGSSSAAHATARSRSQRRPDRAVPEGPERSAGRCRRRRAGAAWRGRSEGHLTWPPPPDRACRR
jgi:hypothetical protein